MEIYGKKGKSRKAEVYCKIGVLRGVCVCVYGEHSS